MFVYEKKLQYPVRIKNTNPKLAALIISQYGGPDGELGASLRYLSQRYSMPWPELKGLLTDIGTEELAHMEMVSVGQLHLGADLFQILCGNGALDGGHSSHIHKYRGLNDPMYRSKSSSFCFSVFLQ